MQNARADLNLHGSLVDLLVSPMNVDVLGDGRIGVSNQLGDCSDVFASLVQNRGVGMPKRMMRAMRLVVEPFDKGP